MPTDLTRQQLGPYSLERLLDVGGMAEVYLAHHQWMPERRVALKVLLPHLTTTEFLRRFRQEAAWLAQLQHRNIVQVYEAGQAGGRWYIAQEYLDGEPLDQTVRRLGRLPFPQAVWIAIQVADALDYAYSYCGLVHRDVKPGNIMLLRDGTTVKLLDFGIAVVLWGTKKARTPIGTLDYAAPEQVRGQADHLSDVYSLGATLYEMVVGRPPQWAQGGQLVRPSQFAPPITLPLPLEQLMVRALDEKPARRPHSARELAAELRQMRMGWQVEGRSFPTHEIPLLKQTPAPAPPRPVSPRPRPPGLAPGARRIRSARQNNPAVWVLAIAALAALMILTVILGLSVEPPRNPGVPTEWIITPQNRNFTPPSYTVTPGPLKAPALAPTPHPLSLGGTDGTDGPGDGLSVERWGAVSLVMHLPGGNCTKSLERGEYIDD